jgi:hypothetical protein
MKKKSIFFKIGSAVQWKWMGRLITGSVKQIHTEPVSKLIKGKLIKRNATEENPAYFLESNSGNFALKLHSEVLAWRPVKIKSSQPKMFGS